MKTGGTQKVVDWSLVILINFMWATQVPVIRLIGNAYGPVTIAFVPMICSTLIFIPVLWMENKRRGVKWKWRWRDLRYFMLPGLIGVFLMQYLYTVGSQMTLAANAGIITLTIPVIVAFFASVLLKEKGNIVRYLSFVLAIGGVLLTSASDLSGANFNSKGLLAGNLVFLLACVCCGFYNTYCKLLVDKQFTELEILVYGSVIGSVAAVPLLVWVEPFHWAGFVHGGKAPLLAMLELSLFVYGISMLLFFYVLKRMDVTQAILGTYLLPFFIALLGIILLGESITWLMFAGGMLILASTLMVTIYETRLLAFFHRKQPGGGVAIVPGEPNKMTE